jgi:hypothetical protein
MAEIKSTLDLVMEKTKHLSLSKEEKEEQKLIEFRKVFNGLMQKFQNQVLTKEELKSELTILQKKFEFRDNSIFIGEILNRLDLTKNNDLYLALLDELFKISVKKIRTILDDFKNSVAKAAAQRIDLIKAELRENHSISGSAVSPNLEKDNILHNKIQEIQNKFDKKLMKEKFKI